MPRRFKVVVEWDDEGQEYVARVPSLLGCLTHAKTRPELMERAQEAIEGYLEALALAGDPLPITDVDVSVEEVEIRP